MKLSTVIALVSVICVSFTEEALGQDCRPFGRVANGRVKYKSRLRLAAFRCGARFTLLGSKIAICIQGTWSHPAPVCIARGCEKPDAIPNLVVTSSRKGAMLFFRCSVGYLPEGAKSVYCDGKKWSDPFPSCIHKDPALQCSFETSDLCDWTQYTGDDFDWSINSGQTSTDGTGPDNDHTYNTTAGRYLYIESSSPRTKGDVATLVSPAYAGLPNGTCFEFYYHMQGDDNEVGKLNVYVRRGDENMENLVPCYTQQGHQSDDWIRGSIDIGHTDTSIQIVISAIRGTSYIGDISIDDVRIYNCSDDDTDAGFPGITPKEASLQTTEAAQIWNTQPETTTRETEVKCQSFPPIKNMRVKYIRWSAMFYCKTPFSLHGSKKAICLEGGWTRSPPVCLANRCAELTVDDRNMTVRKTYGGALLTFTCFPGWSVRGHHSIYCDGEKWSGFPPTCISMLAERSCGFEIIDLCGWTNDVQADLQWTWTTGSTPTDQTGPETDHSHPQKSGHYVYVESSEPADPGDEGRLLSPWYQDVPPGTCFEFYYHMYTEASKGDYSSLSVYLKGTPSDLDPVFTTSGNHGDQWRRGMFEIRREYALMQIVIRATRGDNWAHDVAIDDVRLYRCSDEDTRPSSSATSSQYVDRTITNAAYPSRNKMTTRIPTRPEVTSQNANTRPMPDIPTFAEQFTDGMKTETKSGGPVTEASNKETNSDSVNSVHVVSSPEVVYTTEVASTPDVVSTPEVEYTPEVDNSDHVIGTKHSKVNSAMLSPHGKDKMSEQERHILYTGIVVVLIIMMLLFLTIMVGVQVEWKGGSYYTNEAYDKAECDDVSLKSLNCERQMDIMSIGRANSIQNSSSEKLINVDESKDDIDPTRH